MANGGAAPAASLSLAGRILGLATSLVLHPLLRRGNAAPSTRRVLEVLGAMIGGCAGGTDLRHCQLGGVPVDIVSPGRAGQGSIMYLHGGAYVSGSLRSYRRLVTYLAAATGCRVIAVDYRLAPAHPYPAAYADSLAVYTALVAEPTTGIIVIAGDSAGGGLALATAIGLRDSGVPLPAGLVCIAPWSDLTCSGDSVRSRAGRERMLTPAGLAADARRYAAGADLRSPLVSPLFADLRGLPPMLIQVGEDEILLDDSTRLAASARAAGVTVNLQVWPRLWHVWHLYAGLMPEADNAMRSISDFVAALIRRRG